MRISSLFWYIMRKSQGDDESRDSVIIIIIMMMKNKEPRKKRTQEEVEMRIYSLFSKSEGRRERETFRFLICGKRWEKARKRDPSPVEFSGGPFLPCLRGNSWNLLLLSSASSFFTWVLSFYVFYPLFLPLIPVLLRITVDHVFIHRHLHHPHHHHHPSRHLMAVTAAIATIEADDDHQTSGSSSSWCLGSQDWRLTENLMNIIIVIWVDGVALLKHLFASFIHSNIFILSFFFFFLLRELLLLMLDPDEG